MFRSRKLTLLSVFLIALGTFVALALRPRFRSYWHVPPGDIVTISSGELKKIAAVNLPSVRWKEFRPNEVMTNPDPVLWRRTYTKGLDLFRLANYPVPKNQQAVELEGNLAPIAAWSKRTFFLHPDLTTASKADWIAFKFGGGVKKRSLRDWMTANLEGIRTNGVSLHYHQGNTISNIPCVIAVTLEGIKIMPETALQR